MFSTGGRLLITAALVFAIFPMLCLAAEDAGRSKLSDFSERAVWRLGELAEYVRSLTAPIVLAVVTIAGVIYAAGQAFDANTRKKAQEWSMSLITGALIGLLITAAAPYAVEFLYAGLAG